MKLPVIPASWRLNGQPVAYIFAGVNQILNKPILQFIAV